jgi:hypothetical protein
MNIWKQHVTHLHEVSQRYEPTTDRANPAIALESPQLNEKYPVSRQHSSVSTVTRLRVKQSKNLVIPWRKIFLFSLHNVQSGSGTHAISHSMAT